MKTILLIVSFLIPSTTTTMMPNLAIVTKALSEGDATTVGTYFDASVEMTLVDKQNVFDRNAATNALRDFFTRNKPRSFASVHQGTSKGSASHYTIGDLATAGGTYRVYIYYKSVGDKPVIQELRIEK